MRRIFNQMVHAVISMKQFKLVLHNTSFSEESLVINPKDYPSLRIGDIVEIYLPEDEHSRLLLQVTVLKDDFPQKDTISIEQTIANSFQLRTFADVIVNIVNPKDVALDSVELTFKDQYIARSDMWRIKKYLVNTCVYPNKKIEFCLIRCQVFEMWSQGERVACGVVTPDTKLIYRSACSMVYLFIQMSSEMWDFDINGDLYFEKAVNGFLFDLFTKWKKMNCNHDVTIVLFSRTFYEAHSTEEFPEFMRECLQQDYKGRFYEDFYRIAVQNERYDDWNLILILLKKLFNQYQQLVLQYHQRPNVQIPRAVNSTSSQGNFLEVLNMSLNVFEKHYMDRSFDRTGQLSVVISPGVGVFEVDRELTNITKQRIIDNGIGSDLVCLGEQPLHAVPLFKFHNKQKSTNTFPVIDDYNMPHWINLSFYSSTKQISYSNFVPRIKLPTPLPKAVYEKEKVKVLYHETSPYINQPDPLFDYDGYDSQVFKLPSHTQNARTTHSLQHLSVRCKITPASRKISEDRQSCFMSSDPLPETKSVCVSSTAITIPHRSFQSNLGFMSCSLGTTQMNAKEISLKKPRSRDDLEQDYSPPSRFVVGSAGSSHDYLNNRKNVQRQSKALVNPFDPSHVTIKLTSNRRRWTHVFPLGPTGIFMQQHHYQAVPHNTAATLIPPDIDKELVLSHELLPMSVLTSKNFNRKYSSSHLSSEDVTENGKDQKDEKKSKEVHSSASYTNLFGAMDTRNRSIARVSTSSDTQDNSSTSWLWGATGEQEWTPALTTGVDWKSLVIPACLPITTDYFPDKQSLHNDYVISDYCLSPDVSMDMIQRRCYRGNEDSVHHSPMKTSEVYHELICQRLQQGFQIIVLPKHYSTNLYCSTNSSPQFAPSLLRGPFASDQSEEYLLSIGRIFHKLTLDNFTITVTQYRPRHPYPVMNIHYCYRFHAPDNDTYGVSWVDFSSEKLENYMWNYVDHYICLRGEADYKLHECSKFWRLRLLVLPGGQAATKSIIENVVKDCDIYDEITPEEKSQHREGFLKLLEVLNRIRRHPNNRKKTVPSSSQMRRFSLGQTLPSQSTVSGQSSINSFRERVGSNRVHDRPRSRSGSKGIDRVRTELSGGSGRVSPAAEADKLGGSSSSLETMQECGTVCTDDINQEPKWLNLKSPLIDVIEIMKHPVTGLTFLNKQAGLPPWTFISGEAVFWLKKYVDGIVSDLQAIQTLQKMQREKLICHASGESRLEFLHGFYLYYIVSQDKDSDFECQLGDIEVFQKEWLEVELLPVKHESDNEMGFSWLSPGDVDDIYEIPDGESRLQFKSTNVDIDINNKSDRLEWGHARYHSIFQPGEAFEITIEWMVATGNIIADLVQGWARKASSNFNLQLVPIPSDPFALPFSTKSDPLRGPIFIPLNLECLPDSAIYILKEEGLFLFQESIIKRFGFIRHRDPNNINGPCQYVHISGSMFVMIINPNTERNSYNVKSSGKQNEEDLCSPHEQYITRHFSGLMDKEMYAMPSGLNFKVGFLWSWNYMITKRWKSSATGDEHFMRKVMYNFRSFCKNKNGRLREFWNNSCCTENIEENDPLLSME